ncbi:NPC intracellular cholesterol transporter 1-related protein 1 [Fusarium oxysporum f. sp. albedinis]|nr:NPC intracellular cholesterol transporter 1-related protein 1 [Fusarium oxysporum f. sp. albedinis]
MPAWNTRSGPEPLQTCNHHIKQLDLRKQKHTNALALSHLLQSQNGATLTVIAKTGFGPRKSVTISNLFTFGTRQHFLLLETCLDEDNVDLEDGFSYQSWRHWAFLDEIVSAEFLFRLRLSVKDRRDQQIPIAFYTSQVGRDHSRNAQTGIHCRCTLCRKSRCYGRGCTRRRSVKKTRQIAPHAGHRTLKIFRNRPKTATIHRRFILNLSVPEILFSEA